MGLAIGDVSKRTGCSVPTIRYYEEVGLIAPVARAANGRRTYGWPDVSRLLFIRRARDFGMSIEEIRELSVASTYRSGCAHAKAVVTSRLEEVTRKRVELEKLTGNLQAMLVRCEAECGAESAHCTIFGDIQESDVTGFVA